MSNILTLKDICYSYIDGQSKRTILDHLSYQFESGKFYTILGHSGSGKTTLLSIMSGLDTPNSGTMMYEDKVINDKALHDFRRNKVGIVFQQYNLINYLTPLENVMVSMSETDNKLPKDTKKVASKLLEQFGIVSTKANRLVTQLSGGEQQRVAIARALAKNVDLILADEPTGNLDTATEQEIIKIFRDLTENFGKTVIVVTHSVAVSQLSDSRILLKDGQLHDVDAALNKEIESTI